MPKKRSFLRLFTETGPLVAFAVAFLIGIAAPASGHFEHLLLRLPAVGDNAGMEADPSKASPPKHKRRCFQFSLRTLMIVVTLLAVACGYVGWQAKIVRQRRAMLGTIDAVGGRYLAINAGDWPAGMTGPGWIRRFLGDVAVVEIDFHASSLSQDDEPTHSRTSASSNAAATVSERSANMTERESCSFR